MRRRPDTYNYLSRKVWDLAESSNPADYFFVLCELYQLMQARYGATKAARYFKYAGSKKCALRMRVIRTAREFGEAGLSKSEFVRHLVARNKKLKAHGVPKDKRAANGSESERAVRRYLDRAIKGRES